MEHVNHPAHYQRKDGIECIDIISGVVGIMILKQH